MSDKKSVSQGLIEDAQKALENGKVLTPTRKERFRIQEELQQKQDRVLLGSAILSTLMLYNLDDMQEMNLARTKFKYDAKRYHQHLEEHLNVIFDGVNMPNDDKEELAKAVDESAQFIDEAVRVITKFLDEYISS